MFDPTLDEETSSKQRRKWFAIVVVVTVFNLWVNVSYDHTIFTLFYVGLLSTATAAFFFSRKNRSKWGERIAILDAVLCAILLVLSALAVMYLPKYFLKPEEYGILLNFIFTLLRTIFMMIFLRKF